MLGVCDEHQKDKFGFSGVSDKEMITSPIGWAHMKHVDEYLVCMLLLLVLTSLLFVTYPLSIHVCLPLNHVPILCDPMDYSLPGSAVHEIFPGKNTGVGCHFLLQGIFLTQGSNACLLCLLHWQGDSLPPNDLRSPKYT